MTSSGALADRAPRRRRLMRLPALALPAAFALTAPLAWPAAAAHAGHRSGPRTCAWSAVRSPSPGSARNILFGLSAVPGERGQMWAVGDRLSADRPRTVAPVADHWNGSAWTARVLPGRQSNLLGVTAISPANIWAVGFYIIYSADTIPVIDHFNGRSWVTVPSPRIRFGVLAGIAALSPRNIWAVGRELDHHPSSTLIEHYNGIRWSRVPSPSPPGTSYIDFGAISARSASDIWVAGDYELSPSGLFRTLIEHYDGHRWRIVPSPNLGPGSNYLTSIAAVGRHRLWAVGQARQGSAYAPLGLAWNGRAWHAMALPASGSRNNALNGLVSYGNGQMLAVGSAGRAGHQRTLVEHYRDGRWSIQPSPSPGRADNALYAVAVTGARAWAAGGWWSLASGKPITIRRCV